ncbi:MAG: phage head-tail adapter protein [Lachnospiraceae bacterium]|nr:phage head-tail adapter protein [Lachnospiraceae bacterium]
MNKDWSEKNKKMQTLIGKEATFREGIDVLMDLRNDLFQEITSIVNTYPPEAFYQMPFPKAEGYHSKTLVYSMWHIFRIEDIVAHTIILRDSQVLFTEDFLKRTGSPVITTGNEFRGEAIADFSKQLDVKAVHEYCAAVKASTDVMLKKLEYKDLKRKFTEEDKKRVADSQSVSPDEEAVWLIDYWCDKDVRGLIKMPFSRHWIMHIEAMGRIKSKV